MILKLENIKLFTDSVEIAEHEAGAPLQIKVCLCGFETNRNGVRLNRDTIENWMSTLVNAPIVGKTSRNPFTGEEDFTSHNCKIVINENSETEVVFDTEAYGTITSCQIETVNGVEAIYINAEIFARFEKVIDLIIKRVASGNLATSWEIAVSESHLDGGVKVIDNGRFIGHALLGKTVSPAYDESGLLEVASDESVDTELAQAIADDIANKKVGEQMKKPVDFEVSVPNDETTVVAAEEPVVDTSKCGDDEDEKKKSDVVEPSEDDGDEPEETPVNDDDEEKKKTEEADVEQSALTEYDLSERLSRACAAKLNIDWCWVSWFFPAESICWTRYANAPTVLDYAQFSYTVNGDEVTVSNPTYITLVASPRDMSAKLFESSEALVKANEQIQKLTSENTELSELKAELDKVKAEKEAAERAEKQKEISSMLVKSGLVSETELESDESIKTIISECNDGAAKLLIADRLIASLKDEKPEVETSESNAPVVSAQIQDEVPGNGSAAVRAWLFASRK